MSIFGNDLVNVQLFYMIKKNKYGLEIFRILEDEDAKKIMEDPNKAKDVKTINTKWKTLAWHESNYIASRSYARLNQMSDERVFDFNSFRDLKIKMCLKEWDLKDPAGNPVPLIPEMIDKLVPEIILALYNKYEEVTGYAEEEVKKS